MNKFKEWFSLQVTKNPARFILISILLFNIIFIIVAALIISGFSLSGTEDMSFLEAAFYTITMILDAGCVQFVIESIGESGIAAAIICLVIIIVGMISFTGAVIGYTTNYISSFITNSNAGNRKLIISNHVVILNWNSRASEIVNDLMYTAKKQTVVVLSNENRENIIKEIDERLSNTANDEKISKKHVTVLVREGDVFSSKQLQDISIEKARSVIILGNSLANSICKYDTLSKLENNVNGNSLTVKTLMQVAEICGSDYSNDNQKIIVEITDEWTEKLVDQIVAQYAESRSKCKIVPLKVNQVLGQILSQFSLMPELNVAYKDLFSNKGATFYPINLGDYTKMYHEEGEINLIREYLRTHSHSIPLTVMNSDGTEYLYSSSTSESEAFYRTMISPKKVPIDLNQNYWIENKNVIILGHNSNVKEIMQGFCSFRNEWNNKNSDRDILDVIVIDDEKSLEKMNHYKDYPFVTKTISASIYDQDLIVDEIDKFSSSHVEDTSVLILSDDNVSTENIDASSLAYFIYVQNLIKKKLKKDPDFNINSIDIIVEIIDPKHYNLVNEYCGDKSIAKKRNNVVISNRYISKMITQIGEKEALYNFYIDILKYDEEGSSEYESKEIYAKKVSRLFNTLPPKCKVGDLIRSLFEASIDPSLPKGAQNPTIAIGMVDENEKVYLFEGDQYNQEIELHKKDKLIVFSNH